MKITTKTARRLAVLWTLLIFAACSLPGGQVPDISALPIDKFAHFSFFLIFALLWMHASEKALWRRALLVGTGGLMFGIGIEVYQGWLPFSRASDPYDALADIAGLILGLALYLFVTSRRTR